MNVLSWSLMYCKMYWKWNIIWSWQILLKKCHKLVCKKKNFASLDSKFLHGLVFKYFFNTFSSYKTTFESKRYWWMHFIVKKASIQTTQISNFTLNIAFTFLQIEFHDSFRVLAKSCLVYYFIKSHLKFLNIIINLTLPLIILLK